MIFIVIGAVCDRCKKYSPGLFKCKTCGKKFCPLCVNNNTGICKYCEIKQNIQKV